MIKDIDNFAQNELSVSVSVLMDRSGEAVARSLRSLLASDRRVIVLCGGGNNGGDGYAAAVKLSIDCDVLAYDVLCKGQKSDAGIYFLEKFNYYFYFMILSISINNL